MRMCVYDLSNIEDVEGQLLLSTLGKGHTDVTITLHQHDPKTLSKWRN